MEKAKGFIMEDQQVERRLIAVWIEELTGTNAYEAERGMDFENVMEIVEFAEEHDLFAGLTHEQAVGLACFYVGFGTGAANITYRMGLHVPGIPDLVEEGGEE